VADAPFATNPLRLLHLSDIHFSNFVNHQRVIHNDVRERLIEAARDFAAAHGLVHSIVVAGDIAFSGIPAQYREAAAWLERLANATGCPTPGVYTVPGNHDVNIERTTAITRQLHRYYRGASLQQLRNEIDELAKGPTERFLVEKLSDYHAFAAAYGCDFFSPSRPMWARRLRFDARRALRVVGLTSVQVSDLGDAPTGLILGANQYVLDEQDCIEQIVIMHHPFEWLKDRRDAESFIANRARIIITGHEHLSRVQKITEADCDRLVIESGAVTPPETNVPYIYHFQFLEISLSGAAGEECLQVNVHPFVWSLQRQRFLPDTTRLGGPESAEFSLRCPRYRNAHCAQTVGAAGGPAIAPDDPEGGASLEERDDTNVAHLRYLLWRYLDWGQRLEVLIGIDVFGDAVRAEQPQLVERTALQIARERGRLGDLWQRVQHFVPEPKRAANPFT
jgi:metallophosphoesterase superfamily enzyme